MDVKEIQFQEQYPCNGFRVAKSESKPNPIVIRRQGYCTEGRKPFHYERSLFCMVGVSREAGLVPKYTCRIISSVNGWSILPVKRNGMYIAKKFTQ